ncbi:MAG: hypothetical protein HGB21_07745 [Nitrospirae bacterium]|nr:hypothetical protein [Nitrospirota bacterium]
MKRNITIALSVKIRAPHYLTTVVDLFGIGIPPPIITGKRSKVCNNSVTDKISVSPCKERIGIGPIPIGYDLIAVVHIDRYVCRAEINDCVMILNLNTQEGA